MQYALIVECIGIIKFNGSIDYIRSKITAGLILLHGLNERFFYKCITLLFIQVKLLFILLSTYLPIIYYLLVKTPKMEDLK